MLVLLVGTGIFLTVRLRFLTWRNLWYALKSVLSKEARTKKRGSCDISPFSALAATTDNPVRQGYINMPGTFLIQLLFVLLQVLL